MRIKGLFAPTLVAALLLSLAACARSAPATPASAGPGPQTAIPTPVAQSTAARPWYADRLEKLGFYVFPEPVAVPDFSAEALKGGSLSLSALKGKVVLLNFWATWCPPCRAEMPSIEALWKKLKDKPFTVMAVSVGEDKGTVAKFIADQKYSYPIFLDPSSALGTAFNAESIPTTYLFDKQGRAIAGIKGSREYDGPDVVALFGELAAK